MKGRPFVIGIYFLFCLLGAGQSFAQDNSDGSYSYDFRGVPLAQALEEIARRAEINMVYDPGLVEGINVYKRVQNKRVPALLRKILTDTPLDFVILSSGTIVIVEQVSEDPSYGAYYGKVVDGETGEPLPGATVMLADASGGTSTNQTGSFSMNRLVSGSYNIVFSYVGYEPVYKTINLEPKENLHQKIALQPKPVDFAPVVVTAHNPQMPYGSGNEQVTNPQNEWEPKGKMRDAVQSLTLFPGVQYGLPMADLHLQGGRPGEHRIRLDGVPVYNPHSFGQMFSAFSPYAIRKVQLHKAGYGVAEGSQIAGLIDMEHQLGGNENSFMTQGDPLSLNMQGDWKFHLKEDEHSSLKMMGAARMNYWDLYREPTLDQTLQNWNDLDPLITNKLIDSLENASQYQPREYDSDVRFYDLHLASKYDIDTFRSIEASLYAGENFVRTDLLRQAPELENSPEYLYARDEYKWNNTMGQITYNHMISPRFDLSSQLSFSTNKLRHRYVIGTSDNHGIPTLDQRSSRVLAAFESASSQNLVPTQRNANRIEHIIFRADGTYSFTPHFRIDGGLQLDVVESSIDFSDLFYLPTFSNRQSTFTSGYINGHWTVGDYWTFTAGNRLTWSSSSRNLYTEPRASLQIDKPSSSIGYWSFKLAGGRYRQFINQYEITNPGPSSLVPTFTMWSHSGNSKAPEAWHISSSFHLQPTETTALNIDAFYKWQPTTYTISYDNLLREKALGSTTSLAYAESTEMKTFGAAIRINQSTENEKLKFMAGYDYSYARINLNTQFGRRLPVPWNEPHRLQVRSLWRVVPQLTAVAKWQSSWGRSWGFRRSYYNYLFYENSSTIDGYTFRHPENDKLSPFYQLDFSLIYSPDISFMNMELRADLINILDRRNSIDWGLRPEQPGSDSYEKRKRTMPGFSPSLSIQLNF